MCAQMHARWSCWEPRRWFTLTRRKNSCLSSWNTLKNGKPSTRSPRISTSRLEGQLMTMLFLTLIQPSKFSAQWTWKLPAQRIMRHRPQRNHLGVSKAWRKTSKNSLKMTKWWKMRENQSKSDKTLLNCRKLWKKNSRCILTELWTSSKLRWCFWMNSLSFPL